MPSIDPPRPPRRSLGRGPGAGPPGDAPPGESTAGSGATPAEAGVPAPAGPLAVAVDTPIDTPLDAVVDTVADVVVDADGAGGPAPAAPPAPEAPDAPGTAVVPDLPAPGEPAPDLPAPGEPAPDLPAPGEPAPDLPAPGEPVAPAAPEATDTPAATGAPSGDTEGDGRFTVRLANFEGPFDLLLQLISRHKLDVTEVALSKVTGEFMAHIRAMGDDWDLDQTTEFVVVAATLLDLKAARLLPAAEVEDEADLALLEARDLLFARLLQYRAYKRIAEILSDRFEAEGRRYPRTVGLEPHHAALLPEVVIRIGAEGLAGLAARAARPRPEPQVYVDHIHAPLVSVREQGEIVVALLRERGRATFRELVADAGADTLTVVARFLALLELYRDRAVTLDQPEALGELLVGWAGGDGGATVTDEFDRAPDIPEDTA
ncbi:segregation/condensation protein A [Streptomyces sp. NPDC020965]|uniref:segregation and condensation protein A n=1 Tax=Streptomyces sp. NPDC020965 TaxID=3365105 RepID=UPI00378F94A8